VSGRDGRSPRAPLRALLTPRDGSSDQALTDSTSNAIYANGHLIILLASVLASLRQPDT